MNSNLVLFFCAVFVVGSIMLTATTSSLSSSFKVYAANNCDATSICTNNPGSDTQLNNCTRRSTCLNTDFASLNTQNNNCSDGSFCANNALGNSNTQNLNCARVNQCVNIEFGSSSTQNTACVNSGNCFIVDFQYSQNTACQSTGSCRNEGINTNVISNSAPSCTNGDPDTTTICQKDRTFTVPNH